MADSIIGVMWCRNEGDLLPHTIPAALEQVDCLMIVDDDSTDNSWDVIKSFDGQLEYAARRVDAMPTGHSDPRLFTRQHLLNQTRKRFGHQDTWVQIIESDTILLDTDVRAAIDRYAVGDVMVPWHMLNCVRRVWTPEYDLPIIPDNMPLHDYFDACHHMEQLSCYTFRPLPDIHYMSRPTPWPRGLSNYLPENISRKLKKGDNNPLVAHYGLRSPTFYHLKMKDTPMVKHPTWDVSTPESTLRTVPFFNGQWNNNPETFSPISREGWCGFLRGDCRG